MCHSHLNSYELFKSIFNLQSLWGDFTDQLLDGKGGKAYPELADNAGTAYKMGDGRGGERS